MMQPNPTTARAIVRQQQQHQQFYRLNWAPFGIEEKYCIFVRNLATDVTDYLLQETFRAVYPSVKGARVITGKIAGRSKGCGFVMFGDGNEQALAMTEMDGKILSSKPMSVGPGLIIMNTGNQPPHPEVVTSTSENYQNNTTLSVDGLHPTVAVEMLMESFAQFGI